MRVPPIVCRGSLSDCEVHLFVDPIGVGLNRRLVVER